MVCDPLRWSLSVWGSYFNSSKTEIADQTLQLTCSWRSLRDWLARSNQEHSWHAAKFESMFPFASRRSNNPWGILLR